MEHRQGVQAGRTVPSSTMPRAVERDNGRPDKKPGALQGRPSRRRRQYTARSCTAAADRKATSLAQTATRSGGGKHRVSWLLLSSRARTPGTARQSGDRSSTRAGSPLPMTRPLRVCIAPRCRRTCV